MDLHRPAAGTAAPAPVRSGDAWRARFAVVVLAAFVVVGIAVIGPQTGVFPGSEMASDPLQYRDRMEAIFDGAVPYVEADFEHLPVNLVPMALAWVAGGSRGDFAYWVVFALLMVAALYLLTESLAVIGSALGDGRTALRWLAIAGPLFPLVIARNDPLVTVLAVLAARLWIERGRRGADVLLVGAVLAKGWPLVMLADAWWRGRRRAALVIGAVSITMVGAVSLTDGFRETRAFRGVHTESLAGGVLGLVRVVRGEGLGMISTAGARYLDAPGWMRAAGLLVGLALAAAALGALRADYSARRAFTLTGALVGAVLVMSPLLSPQFVLWILPFVALAADRPGVRLAFGVSGLSMVLIAYWRVMEAGAAWWWLTLNMRNVLLLALAVRLVSVAAGDRRTPTGAAG